MIVRYNPHAFRVDGQLRSVPTEQRLARLHGVLETYEPPEGAPFTIVYMYYDVENDDLVIWGDEDYDTQLVQCCARPIVD